MFPQVSRVGIPPSLAHHLDGTPGMTTNRLKALHEVGQSIWLDFIDRTILTNGDLARMIRDLPRDQTWLISLTVLAEMAARRRRRAACAAAYEELLPSDGLFAGSTGVLRGAVAHYLGLLATAAGSYEAAERHFRDAASMHERMQAPFHAARTELEWGQMLLEDPSSASNEGAQQHLERARQTAALHHCAQVERRADRLLETTRSRA